MASTAGARRSTTSSLAKRHASVSENFGKTAAAAATAAKKRPALANITNQRHGGVSQGSGRANVPESSKIVLCSTKIASNKKGPSASKNAVNLPQTSTVKQNVAAAVRAATSLPKSDVMLSKPNVASISCSVELSLDKSDSLSISMDNDSMSTCDSLNSPDIEYMDSNDLAAVDSIERKASNSLCISKNEQISGSMCKRDVLAAIESDEKIIDVDENLDDPQLCATIACDIYKHLRASEVKKRPATNFMEKVQKDINASMRAILVDWLVEVK
ncbi:cyclin A [Striga asiatica]|uniref:Cyclin A n=1 Tax=Striga asiatica TaxID=4170 RepID=A0A5A7PYV0_STRAF|nr:cyclin A [Striga asiatica]